MVLDGTNVGDANALSTTKLPTPQAGGGSSHCLPLASDRVGDYSLPNLLASPPKRMGIEETGFGPFRGTVTGLEMA